MWRSWSGGVVYLVEVGANTTLPILAEVWEILVCISFSQMGQS